MDDHCVAHQLRKLLRMSDSLAENHHCRAVLPGYLLTDNPDDLLIPLRREHLAVELCQRELFPGVQVGLQILNFIGFDPVLHIGKPAVFDGGLQPIFVHRLPEDFREIRIIHPFRRGSHAKQKLRCEILDRITIGFGGAMVSLVNDDVAELIGLELLAVQIDRLQIGEEKVRPVSRFFQSVVHPVAVAVAEDRLKGLFGLG